VWVIGCKTPEIQLPDFTQEETAPGLR